MLSSFKNYKQTGASALILAGLICGYAAPAHAGFNWTPAVNRPTAAAPATAPTMNDSKGPLTPEPDTAPVAAAPVESVDASALPVVPDHGKQAVGMTTLPANPPEKAEEPLVIDNTSPAPEEAPVADASTRPTANTAEPAPTVTAEPTPASQSSADVQVQGFGSDIPLAIALRDIAPTGYAYAFANKDVAGTKISWQGGKPWKHVLTLALADKGLVAVVEGNVIRISPIGKIAKADASAIPLATEAHAPTSDAPLSEAPAAAATPETAPATDKPMDITAAATAPAEPTPATPTTYSAKDTVVDLTSHITWQARPGSTLREILTNWSKTAKVELQWLTPYDFPINNAFMYDGTFNEAVSSLLASYSRETPRPRGRLYPNAPDGPSVLMIN